MKRTRIIMLTLVASLVLLGAGYASWTDALTITNTVTTGDLNVQFQNASLVSTETSTPNYITPSCALSPKGVTLTIDNMYPGEGATLNTMYQNIGTIPAKIKAASFVVDSSYVAPTGKTLLTDLSKIQLAGNIVRYNAAGTVVETISLAGKNLVELNAVLGNLVGKQLEPAATKLGEYVQFENVSFKLDPADTDSENKAVKFNIQFDFGQHNM